MTTQISNYEQQAIDFLQSTGTTFSATFLKNSKHFDNDKEVRDIYMIELKRGSRKYTFNFGQSIMDSQYYQDSIQGRTYTLSGDCRTGNYKIHDIHKYLSGSQKLTLVKGIAPNAYDVLASLTKYDCGTFEDFCSEFGYDTDSKSAEKTYNAVVKEYQMVCALWNDTEIEQLQEIQ